MGLRKIAIRVSLLTRIPFYTYPLLRKFHKYFWNTIAALTSRKLFNKQLVETSLARINSKNLRNISESINSIGFAVISADVLEKNCPAGNYSIVKKLLDIVNDFDIKAKSYGTKSYLRNIPNHLLSHESLREFYAYSTSNLFTDIARYYFQEEPLLIDMQLIVSPESRGGNNLDYSGSQLWHSDFDDSKILKFFLYLEDVDKEQGPLELLNRIDSHKIIQKSNYRWDSKSSHDDNLIDKSYKFESMTVKQGSIVVADTANCFHRGSRDVEGRRSAMVVTYVTRTSFRYPPYHWLLPKLFRNFLLPLSSPILSIDKKMKFLDSYAVNN